MLGVGAEGPPTISSIVAISGLVTRRMLGGGGLLSVALLLSYMNDTHGDLPRCLFPGL